MFPSGEVRRVHDEPFEGIERAWSGHRYPQVGRHRVGQHATHGIGDGADDRLGTSVGGRGKSLNVLSRWGTQGVERDAQVRPAQIYGDDRVHGGSISRSLPPNAFVEGWGVWVRMPSMSEDISPVRRQYLEIKRQHPGAIVFFRLGDFYETFDQDAETAARELDIVLTSRNVAKGVRVPMAGIPFHALNSYLARLIERGFHVAICEQLGETPVRGLFPRQVVRVVTPGTVVEPGLLKGDANNFLASVIVEPEGLGLAFADISTGEFFATETQGGDSESVLRQELARIRPAEVLLVEDGALEGEWLGHTTHLAAWRFEGERAAETLREHFRAAHLAGFGLEAKPLATRAAGALVDYLRETQPAALSLLTRPFHLYLRRFHGPGRRHPAQPRVDGNTPHR